MLKVNIKKNGLENVDIYNLGSWKQKAVIKFVSGLNGMSCAYEDRRLGGKCIDKGEEVEIQVEALDNLFYDIPITFIKMDIEGAEKESLFGAKKIIQKYKPKLAICVYHKWEDIYEIPQIIKNFVPEYKIYLRHHSYGLTETVCYACL